MSHYRIRREGMEFPVAGLEALLRLVQEGTLGPLDRVHDPVTDAWVPATELPDLAEAFAQREQERASRRNRRPRPRPSLTGDGEQAPIAPTTPQTPSPFEIPPDLVAPAQGSSSQPVTPQIGPSRGGAQPRASGTHDPDPPTDPGRDVPGPSGPPPSEDGGSDRGRVIEFIEGDPVRRQLGSLPPFGTSLDPDQAGAAMRDPAAFLRSADVPHPSQPKPKVRPTLLLMTVLVGLVGAFLLVSYVQQSANMYNARVSSASGNPKTTRPPRERGVGEVVEPTDPAVPVSPQGESPAGLYEDMELELRNRMVAGCATIEREEDLDTALRIELSRLGVKAYSLHAPILTWGGRRGDMPLAVEIQIWYEGQPGELDRELGAISLVVGKYAQHYGMDVRSFEIYVRNAKGEPRKRAIDPNLAQQLYLRRITLFEFLTGASG